jgi:acetyl esterase/lipase
MTPRRVRHSPLRGAALALLALACFAGSAVAAPAPAEPEVRANLAYAGNANPRQTLDLYLPRARTAGVRLPVIVYFHGGGWVGGSKASGKASLTPWVMDGGYAGAAVNYRLAGEAPWPAQIHDAKAAIRWLRANAERLGLDPGRIAAVGTSAGGTLATLLGTSGGDPVLEGAVGEYPGVGSGVTCVLNRFGRLNFLAEPAARSAPTQAEALAGRLRLLFGGPLEERTAVARAASPLTYLSADDPPVLTVHGTADGVVPIAQAEEFHAAARRIGARHELVRVEGAGHGFDQPDERRRSREFLDRHLREQPAR